MPPCSLGETGKIARSDSPNESETRTRSRSAPPSGSRPARTAARAHPSSKRANAPVTQKALQLAGIEVGARSPNAAVTKGSSIPIRAGWRRSRPCGSAGSDLGRDDRGGDRVKCEVAVDADEAAAKLDRREVALAGGAQAHDEAQGAGRHAVLGRVRDDRRIEQRRRLQAVLAHEVGADQQRLQRRRLHSRRHEVSQLPIAVGEDGLDAGMLMAQAPHDVLQPGLDLERGQLENPLDDLAEAAIAAGQERAQQHARVVGAQILARAPDRKSVATPSRDHWRLDPCAPVLASECICAKLGLEPGDRSAVAAASLTSALAAVDTCRVVISSSASRKASVDSAPWFRLIRSKCKPS